MPRCKVGDTALDAAAEPAPCCFCSSCPPVMAAGEAEDLPGGTGKLNEGIQNLLIPSIDQTFGRKLRVNAMLLYEYIPNRGTGRCA